MPMGARLIQDRDSRAAQDKGSADTIQNTQWILEQAAALVD